MYCMCVSTYVYVHTNVYIRMYVYTYVGMFIASVCTYIHAYTSHTVELWLSNPLSKVSEKAFG